MLLKRVGNLLRQEEMIRDARIFLWSFTSMLIFALCMSESPSMSDWILGFFSLS